MEVIVGPRVDVDVGVCKQGKQVCAANFFFELDFTFFIRHSSLGPGRFVPQVLC